MSAKPTFRSILTDKTPLLFDGAIGTELYNRGIFINRSFEDANLTNRHLVKELHTAYYEAGADVLTTNSFSANPFRLKAHNLQNKTRSINYEAARLVKEIQGDMGYCAGSVGPLGVRIEPLGPTSFDEAYAAFKEQISGLLDGGADIITLETFTEISELQQAIRACRDLNPEIPVIAHVVADQQGQLPFGTPVEWAVQKLDEWGVDAIGLNCSVGPSPMLAVVDRIKAITTTPISVQPNAGLPKMVDGRHIYMCTPEYMAEFTKHFLQAGVQFVGGCCGTTPEHIKAMGKAFRHQMAMTGGEAKQWSAPKAAVTQVTQAQAEAERVPAEQKSQWAKKIARGEWVTTIELLPPAGVVPDNILASSRQIKEAGIDGINIPDGPRASCRMSAILTAVMIEQQVGIETILHYTCRDRNLVSMQSDLLGAHAIGLRNMLLVTGDPPKLGSYPNATGVFDVDAIGLTNMAHKLNGGLDLGGRAIGEPTALSIGVGVNPVHRDLDYEMKRFRYKVEAGAEWAITQPVFDTAAMFTFLEHIDKENIKVPIIAGIWPLTSLRNAEFMNNEVPGIVIPQPVIDRMAKMTSPEDSKKMGVEIAQEMLEELGTSIQGVQVSAPFGRIDLAVKVIEGRSATAADCAGCC